MRGCAPPTTSSRAPRTDRRAVALVPLSQGAHDISLETADSARVRLQQIQPVPYTVDRSATLPSLSQFLSKATKRRNWSGCPMAVDLAHGADFVKKLAQTVGAHPLTIVAGGVPEPAR